MTRAADAGMFSGVYVLFAALPFIGHLNPLIRQAAALKRRGWRVAVASAHEVAAHVTSEADDVPFIDLGELGAIDARLRTVMEIASAEPDYRRGAMQLLPPLLEMWPLLFDGLMNTIAADRPDGMVIDLFTSAALCAAEKAGVPFVVNNPSLLNSVPTQLMAPDWRIPFALSPRSIHDTRAWHRMLEPVSRHALQLAVSITLERPLTKLRASRGLPPVALHQLIRGRMLMVNGAFGLEYERRLPPDLHMVGPMLGDLPANDPLDGWLSDGGPVTYANLGTVSRAPVEQLRRMVDGFAGSGMRTLWVVKDSLRERLPEALPESIRVVPRVASPRAVLSHSNVRVFVSHCGMNSVYESVVAGTPIVGIPMLSDQRDMAVRVADAGVGEWMDKSRFTSAQLSSAIRRVSGDDAYRRRIVPVQDACVRAGGVERAVDLIAGAIASSSAVAASR